MGIGTHVVALRRVATCSERGVALEKAAAQLVDGAGMGRGYKVMGVAGDGWRGHRRSVII